MLATLGVPPPHGWAAGPWYVDPAGSNSNDCLSPATACLTIGAAITKASAGDTVNVAAGTYNEQISITKALTVTGADGAVLDGTGLAPTWTTGVKIRSGNVTFNNIDVTNYTQDGITAYDNIDMPNLHITNCKISNIQPGYWGFGIYVGYESEGFGYVPPDLTTHLDFSGLLIEGNEITNTHSSALVLQSITGTPGTLIVKNNDIHDNVTNDGIWVDCARELTIENNFVDSNRWGIEFSALAEDPAWDTPTLNGPYSPQNVTVRNNTFTGSTDQGFALHNGWPATITVQGNIIEGNGTGAENSLSETVNVTGNWWGSATGPTVASNVLGSGDTAVGAVDYSPWLKNGTDSDLVTSGFQKVVPTTYVVNANNPPAYTTGGIPDGIGVAGDGDTVEALAGAYTEMLTLSDATADDLTVQSSDPGNLAEMTGGVRFTNTGANPLDALTLRNLVIKGDGDTSAREAIIYMANTGAVNDLSIEGCVIDGEGVHLPGDGFEGGSGRNGMVGNRLGGSFSVTGSEFKNIMGWALLDMDASSDYSPLGGNGLALTGVTFSGNSVHDSNGSVSLRGNHTTRTPVVTVENSSWDNIGGVGGFQGGQWAAVEVNNAALLHFQGNVINDVQLGFYGEGQAVQLWNVETLDFTCNAISNNYQGVYLYSDGVGGTFCGSFGCPVPAGTVAANSFIGNSQYALSVNAAAVGGPLSAENNWWGCTSGPGSPGCDTIDGAVDAVPAATFVPACVPCSADAECDDGVFCSGLETCSGGSCTAPPGDPCTAGGECANVCNETADTCNVPAATACTDDGNVCTTNLCDGNGACAANPNTLPCNDALYCNGADTCSGGSCQHTGDPCTGGSECADACNEAVDNCLDLAGTSCTDEGNICTTNACDGSGACLATNNTLPCNDALFCNGADTCAGGSCTHAGDPCTGGSECANACNEAAGNCNDLAGTSCTDDGNVCTTNACDGGGLCAATNNTLPCDDGVTCTTGDVCSAGACTGADGQFASLCRWTLLVRDDPNGDRIKTGQQSVVEGDICASQLVLGASSLDDGSVVATDATGAAVIKIGSAAEIAADIVSGGGGAKGKPSAVKLPATNVTSLAAGSVTAKDDASGDYDLSGAHSLVAACAGARGSYASTSAYLAALPSDLDGGAILLRAGESATLTAPIPGTLNVIDVDDVRGSSDTVLELDGGGNADTAIVLRIAENLHMRANASITLVGGLTPDRVLIYVQGRKCDFGNHFQGAGTLLCVAGRIQADYDTVWTGAWFAGKGVMNVGDRTELIYQPFLAF
ncbi:MAG: hypothetical protein HY899_02310 [Deltaproteobacteria bacterium]|nr:hypothetical protein [Deltaproteobacteria bacterium]